MRNLAWTVDFDPRALRQLKKLDRPVANRVVKVIEEISALDDPRSRGKALTGNFAGLWRYRAGDWRILVALEDGRLLILVVSVDHRSRVYE